MSSKKPVRPVSLDAIELSLSASRLPTLDWVSPCDSIVDLFLDHDYVARTECIPDQSHPVYNTKILLKLPKQVTGKEHVRFVFSDVSDYMSNSSCQVQLEDQIGVASVALSHLLNALDGAPLAVPIVATKPELKEAIAKTQPSLFVHARVPVPLSAASRALKMSFGLINVPLKEKSNRNDLSSLSSSNPSVAQDLLNAHRFSSDEFQIAVFSNNSHSGEDSLLALTSPFSLGATEKAGKKNGQQSVTIPESTVVRLPFNTDSLDGSYVCRVYAAQDIADWLVQRKSLLTYQSTRGLPCQGEFIASPKSLLKEQRAKISTALVYPLTSPNGINNKNPTPQKQQSRDPSIAIRLVVEEPIAQSASDTLADLIEAERRRRWSHWSRAQLAAFSNYKTFLHITPEEGEFAENEKEQSLNQVPQTPSRKNVQNSNGPATPLSVATPSGRVSDDVTRLVQQHLHRLQIAGEGILYRLKGSEYVSLDRSVQDAKNVISRCQAFLENPTDGPQNRKLVILEADRQAITSRLAWIGQLLDDGVKRLEEIVSFERSLLIAVRSRDGERIAELIKEAVYERGLGHLKAVRENMAFASWSGSSKAVGNTVKDVEKDSDKELLSNPAHRMLCLICLIAYYFVSSFTGMLINQTPYPLNPLDAEYSSPLLDGKLMLNGLMIVLYFFAARCLLLLLFGDHIPKAIRKLLAFGESLTPAVFLMLPFIYGIRATTRASLSVIFALPWELMACIFVIALASAVSTISSKKIASTSLRGLGYVLPSVLGALLTLFLAGLMPKSSSAPGLVAAGLTYLASVMEPQWVPSDLGRLAMATAYLVLEDAIRPINDIVYT